MEMAISTRLEVSWDMDLSVSSMETFVPASPTAQVYCSSLGAVPSVNKRERWGQLWDVQGRCIDLCKLSDFFGHDERNNRSCWNDFKQFGVNLTYTPLQFLESIGRRQVSLITAKNDWVVDHAQRKKLNNVELVPQGRVGVLLFEYLYELAHEAPWFFWHSQSDAPRQGGNHNAKTIILDHDRSPYGEPISPGDSLHLRVDEVWLLAERPPGEYVEALDARAMTTGAEIMAKVDCFNTDDEAARSLGERSRNKKWHWGASLAEPVCFLSFAITSEEYQVAVKYGSASPGSIEVMSETTGITFKTEGGAGTALLKDLNTLLVNVTSIMVLLAVPTSMTRLIATRALGPISNMYRRVIIEPYDIEEQTAATATVIAANVKSFQGLATKNELGEDRIELSALKKLLQIAFETRRDLIDEDELASLAYFCYDAMRRRATTRLAPTWFDPFDVGIFREDSQLQDNKDGISLDQFNQVRLDCEKLTFDSVVQLFDKDRRRNWFEKFFTPRRIKKSLMRVMSQTERARFSNSARLRSFVEHAGAASKELACALHLNSIPLKRAGTSITASVGTLDMEWSSETADSTLAPKTTQGGALSTQSLASPPDEVDLATVDATVETSELQEEVEPEPLQLEDPEQGLTDTVQVREDGLLEQKMEEVVKRLTDLETHLAMETKTNWRERRSRRASPSSKQLNLAWAAAIMESLGDLKPPSPARGSGAAQAGAEERA